MSTYFFLLGNTPELSFLELQSVLPETAGVTLVADSIGQAELENDLAALNIMDISGGTVKILRLIKQVEGHKPEEIEPQIFDQMLEVLRNSGQDKLTYAVSEIGRDHLPAISADMFKSKLLKEGYKARYVDGPRTGLSASVLLHHKKTLELVVIQTASGVFLAETVAIQDIDGWSFRDRAKPYADRKKGMLPPKVARMMINIGLRHIERETSPQNPAVLYDPFCGTGTVLTEGLLRDCHVIGSDTDPEAVAGSIENLQWLINNLADQTIPELFYQVFQADVSNAHPGQFQKQPDMIVTEPFLGKPKAQADQVPNIIKGLNKLYLGAFKNWARVLPNKAVVVIVLPLIDTGKQQFTMQALIDKLPDLGYTTLLTPIVYGRPQAITHRQLYVFRLNK